VLQAERIRYYLNYVRRHILPLVQCTLLESVITFT
jgi:hypothetical protein